MSISLGNPRDKVLPHLVDGSLSPFTSRLSRPSSRTSLRSHSPSYSLDDPVAVRQHMSSLKHNIRQKQAQLNNLESIVRSGPRPYGSELNDDIYTSSSTNLASSASVFQGMSSTSSPPPPSSFIAPTGSSASPTTIKIRRRSSHDVLQSIAGPDSNLPLPKRESIIGEESLISGGAGIREGIPMNFSISNGAGYNYKRQSSPTKSLSRIPISSVGNARALTEEGNITSPSPRPRLKSDSPDLSPSSVSIPALPSPNKRFSLTPGGTTKVLADLQTGVVNARNALENTKAQLRMSQRTVASLTRQTEDLKEARERLRLENEGLNNVVARKERLLQEVLERARKAEAELTTLKGQLKTETSTSKKALREMESALTESTALSQRSEREYITLRDSVKHLTESWKHDIDRLKDEMKKREDKVKSEGERLGKMYKDLLSELKKAQEGEKDVKRLWNDDKKQDEEVKKYWIEEIERIKQGVEKQEKKSDEAHKIARHLADELTRLRRLMQTAGRSASEEDQDRKPPP